MASLNELLISYNAKASEMNLTPRKKFRDRRDAYNAMSKIGMNVEELLADAPLPEARRRTPAKKAKKAATKKTKKKTSSSNRSRSKRIVSEEEDAAIAEFQTLRGSKQHKVLVALISANEKPVSLSQLAKAAGSPVGAARAIVGGISAKLDGRLLRGSGNKPRYKLIKTKEGKESYFVLQKENSKD